MASNWFPKPPGATRRISYDWTPFLTAETGESINSAQWEIPDDLLVADPAYAGPSLVGNVTTVWITGGVTGVTYQLVSRVVTNQGTVMPGSLYVEIIPV